MHRDHRRSLLPPVLLVLLALGASPVARAENREDIRAIVAAAKNAALAEFRGEHSAIAEVTPVDPRLNLPACAGALGAGIAPGTRGAARLTVEVRCLEPRWHVYVPVLMRVSEQVLIATRAIPRLAPLGPDDVAVVERELDALPSGFYRDLAQVQGSVAARTIGSGEVLSPDLLKIAALVHRGQQVTLIAHRGPLTVHGLGIVQADAGMDQRVLVRNASTARSVEGVVKGADVVEVALP
jgi:flagellar basal body P-ring formation protein FlgA